MEKKLSVAIITYNEAHNIARTLQAVESIADEIIIVDSFSTDATPAICQSFKKVVFTQHAFLGFGQQKNYALSLCHGRWILFIDADEVLEPDALQIIKKIINTRGELGTVFYLKLNNYIFGKPIQHGGWGSIWRERLFMKAVGQYSNATVHEKFITKENPKKLNASLAHHTYNTIHQHLDKMNSYTEKMSQRMYKNGKRTSIPALIYKPIFSFIKPYFLQCGFLDGSIGFYLAIMNAVYTFLKYMKLYNLQIK